MMVPISFYFVCHYLGLKLLFFPRTAKGNVFNIFNVFTLDIYLIYLSTFKKFSITLEKLNAVVCLFLLVVE